MKKTLKLMAVAALVCYGSAIVAASAETIRQMKHDAYRAKTVEAFEQVKNNVVQLQRENNSKEAKELLDTLQTHVAKALDSKPKPNVATLEKLNNLQNQILKIRISLEHTSRSIMHQ